MIPKISASLQDITLEIVDEIKVVVPDSLELITPYVLREQLDWFEDEIKFVRTLLQPGDVVLDIGANYGVYALSMAKVVGENGHVYAFEPASKTASYLQRSIEQNNFGHVTLIRAALSNKSGVAEFGLSDNSELNSLNISMVSHGNTESVALTTLDTLAAELPWHGIKFIKLDAEGEEANILLGGAKFLAEESPLVMFELKHGKEVHTHLIQQFRGLDYQLFKLIPGLGLLAPFSLDEEIDAYQLNLFACKQDCARQLEQEGKLVQSDSNIYDEITAPESWENSIRQYPYAKLLNSKWQAAQQSSPIADGRKYLSVLSTYTSINTTVPASIRYSRLRSACFTLQELCVSSPTLPRLISLSRIQNEMGRRHLALINIGKALALVRQGLIILDEPFLATSIRFAVLDPQNKITNWLVASLLEHAEKLEYFSSYYSGQRTWQRLTSIQNTGFQSMEMDRRIQMIKQRFSM